MIGSPVVRREYSPRSHQQGKQTANVVIRKNGKDLPWEGKAYRNSDIL